MRRNILENILILVFAVASLNAAYLSYRFITVTEDPSQIGTSLCSFTDYVDCDKVLSTPQARVFWVPNAILGLAFHLGCLVWLILGWRMENQLSSPFLKILLTFLLIAFFTTFLFWYLLLRLDFFCVLCPVNHLAVYAELAIVLLLLNRIKGQKDSKGQEKFDLRKLAVPISISVGIFILLHLLWALFFTTSGWEWSIIWQF